MKLSDFDYNLPKELIAQYPSDERDTSRLLILDKVHNTISHRYFKDIADYLRSGDLLVLNDTKVLTARLQGRRPTGGKVEVLLLKQNNGRRFNALMRPSRLKINEQIIFDHSSITAHILSKDEIEFDTDDIEKIYALGKMPLPPYIKRGVEKLDLERYQTVYAKRSGAVASPTAGLHFTEALMEKIRAKGVEIVFVTLHVGYATFTPVKCDDISRHVMESECFEVHDDTYKRISEAKSASRRIIAVGTTTCRVLETLDYKQTDGPVSGETNLFIYPGYKFKIVDSLITNFHLPCTSLIMLVSAFAGQDFIMAAYNEAINRRYRFYSYGDAMLII